MANGTASSDRDSEITANDFANSTKFESNTTSEAAPSAPYFGLESTGQSTGNLSTDSTYEPTAQEQFSNSTTPVTFKAKWDGNSISGVSPTTFTDRDNRTVPDIATRNQHIKSPITNHSFLLDDSSPSLSPNNWTESSLFNRTPSHLSPFNSTVELKAFNSTAQPDAVQTSTVGGDLVQYVRSTNKSSFQIAYDLSGFDNDSLTFNASDNITDYNVTELLQINYKHPVLGIFLSLVVVVVIVGNLLVIGAVARERYLRSVTNYLIVSLAVADLLVGGIVMPFSIVLEMTSGIWLFTHIWCDLWHSFDVLGSTASILNLCVIALDRYWAITDPIAYPTKMSNKRVWILISLVWVCSAVISFPAILWWRAVSPHINESQCVFSEDSGYLIFSSIVSFYTPLIIMLFVYYRIYKAATARTKSLLTGTKVIAPDGVRGEVMTLRIHRGKATVRNGHDNINYHRTAYTDTETDSASHMTRSDSEEDHRPARFIKKKIQKFAIGRKLSKLAKEQKAAKTLGIVMGVFIICWVPFFLTNVLWAICRDACVVFPNVFFPIFTWLGYLNSGMNPIIYALSMRDFRRAFRRLMCSWCPNYNIRAKAKMFHVRSMSTSSFTGPVCTTTERYTTTRS